MLKGGGCEARTLATLNAVPEGLRCAFGVLCSLHGDRAAQRCPHMPHCWARAYWLHHQHQAQILVEPAPRAVKSGGAFDAQDRTFCQASVIRSSVELPSGARRQQYTHHRAQSACARLLPAGAIRTASLKTDKTRLFTVPRHDPLSNVKKSN